MTQLIVQVLDRVSQTQDKHVQLLKRGDVVDCLPDGMHPGTMTLRLDYWRILVVPDLAAFAGIQLLKVEEAEGFIIDERGPKGPGHFGLKIRALGLDLDHPEIPADMRAWLEDFARRQPCWTCGADLIRRITMRKPPGPQVPVTIASRARVIA